MHHLYFIYGDCSKEFCFRGGLLPGDIVVNINGKPVKRANDVYEVLKDHTAVQLNVKVSRRGQILTLQITPEVVF